MNNRWPLICLGLLIAACQSSAERQAETFDLILKGGTVYDGSGKPGVVRDVGVRGDRIVRVGDLAGFTAKLVLDVRGRAVAPGFINVLSHSEESLIADGHSQGEIREGVTLEIMGEGFSMGPFNEAMKAEALKQQADIKYPIEWTTLGE